MTLPLIGPTLRVSVFLSVIGALQLFDMVWVMTGGGPLNASTTMAVNMFKTGFEKQQMGYGSALAVLLFLCALVVALAVPAVRAPSRHRRRRDRLQRMSR